MQSSDRRQFLINAFKISGQIALANSLVYSVSLLSSNQKWGTVTAGAKTMVTCWCGNMDGGCYWKANGPDGCHAANPICTPVSFPEPPGCPDG